MLNIERNSECPVLFAIIQIFINHRNSYMFPMAFRLQAGLFFILQTERKQTLVASDEMQDPD